MSETTTAEGRVKTYRGESMVALLAQIRTELGPDAVIVRQREGLVGGVGGFFQKRCVEVDARPGGLGIDLYDEEPEPPEPPLRAFEEPQPRVPAAPAAPRLEEPPAPVPEPPAPEPAMPRLAEPRPEQPRETIAPLVRNDAATREGLATPAVQELVEQAQPFAEILSEVDETAEPEPATAEPIGPPRAEALRQGMAAAGLGEDIAREVVDSVVASAMPFVTPARMRTLVRNQLALRIPIAPAAAPGPRTIVMVGPAGSGKTTAIEAIAAAHAAQGTPVSRLDLDRPPRPGETVEGLLLVDTPPLWGGAEALAEVARHVRKLEHPEVHLVMRASTAAAAAAELLEGLAALRPNRLLLSGAGETSHLGGVVDVAIRTGTPLGYVAESRREIALADPRELATKVTP